MAAGSFRALAAELSEQTSRFRACARFRGCQPTATILKNPYNANHSYLQSHSKTVRLSDLPKGAFAVVERVEDAHPDDPIAQRLRDLGFVAGEKVRLVALGPIARDPLLIQIGSTRFALRRGEAQRVSVTVQELA